MTYKEIQKKLEKCELALTSIQNGTYTNGKLSEKEAFKKITTIKESLEKKLNLLKEEEGRITTDDPAQAEKLAKKGIDVDLKEDEEAEEENIDTIHTELVAQEIHKALVDALQEKGSEVSDHSISSLYPENFTIGVRYKDNTSEDFSFEFIDGQVKHEGNTIVSANEKGVTPVLNKTIAKDNLSKYLGQLDEKKGKDLDGDGDIDSDDYLLAKDKAIKANMKEEETEFEADAKGKPTGNLRAKLSDKDRETLKKIEDLLSKEKNETKGAPKGHYFTKSGNLVKGRLTKDARERGARLSDPKDKQRSKIPPVTQYNEGEGDDHHYIKVPRREYKKAMSILDGASDGNFVKMDFVDDDGAGNVIIYFKFSDGYIASGQADAYMYDAVMDLQAQDVNISDHSAELDEALDINDPALMRARVAKMRADDMKKLDAYKKSPEGRAAARAQASAERKEEKAREVVRKLKIKRAQIEREMENDPEIEPQGGPVADMYGDQLNKIDNAIEKTASVYSKPMDYDTAVGKVTEEDKMKEHIAVGHPDNEPGMLKQDVHDIAHYAVKLYKLLKYYESLEDQVDFPHWWQSKVVKAREYISKAAHYLEFKTNEPAIDAQVGALQEDEEPTKADMAKEKSLAKKAALLQFIASMQQKGILDKDKKVLDKDAYKKELDAFKKNVKEGRNLNELSGDQRNDLVELQNILDDVVQKGEEAREIIRQSFPNMLSKADAYGAFDFGSSANRYDTTLESIIEEIEEYYDEEDMDEGKYKSDAQRKAVHASKAELKEEMDGGRLFDYFNSKGYDITERRPDGYPAKEGVVGYQVSRGNDRYPQSVIFQYNTNNNEFTISRMSGYRIDQKEAIKAGMREAGRSGAAGMDSYMTDGNYTPVGISAEGLKDIVDHVMSGLDREGQAQSDFYKDRGPTSGTIDEGATCCGRCGRVHVKGSGCKRPYLKGKDHCRTK